MLGLQNEREWAAFCEIVVERPELCNEPRFASPEKRSAAREQLHGIVCEVFRSCPDSRSWRGWSERASLLRI